MSSALIAVGDTKGNLGFLLFGKQHNELFEVDEELDKIDEAFEKEVVFQYEPFRRPISCLHYGLDYNTDKLYMSSHDGSVRCLNLDKEIFTEIVEEEEGYSGQHWIAFRDKDSLFTADASGFIHALDVRMRDSKIRDYDVHNKKVTSIDFNPRDNNYFTTASNDTTVSIWDVRNLKKYNTKAVCTIDSHSRAVSSSFYSPSGDKILTTSYDDSIRITENLLENKWSQTVIRHNNQTGRWVSNFQANWGLTDDLFFVGNMKRQLDIYRTKDKGTKFFLTGYNHSEFLTAIPAVNTIHNIEGHSIIASVSASGYVYIWYDQSFL